MLEIMGLFSDSLGTEFRLSNCPCVPFLCVLSKLNNGIGCVLPQGECLVAF